jgi:antitoxin (DNA-binding transcriptional repressor) of toxin-antitoxin stability system
MHQVTIHQAKTNLSKLIQESLTGETVVIAKGHRPLVRLTPVRKPAPVRRSGGLKGLIEFVADDFDEPLADFQEYMG